ncbi:TioE family transcriptional regulator [Streptomyces olivaceus]|uniref:TioE family transcriptional regulator n=1 Tax=Streptomyces olivaceus TaxID=47716 RepID=UPI001CCCDCC2|nr:TioE family transcriptional regulator [Streptomyces olivaceus]MBZ6294129.1 TioE family transcriptional regulator [Streptomyces olivaceus]MBZ6329293.1 TioE family transcriptional regulator [Streptomyces olivaceus]
MADKLQSTVRLRPVDLARGHGLSTQAVRNYEESGILPPARRTEHGYRTYTALHTRALDAFLALLPGHGHRTAAAVMRAVNEGARGEAFRLIDESHAQLRDDRLTLEAVEAALRDLPLPAEPPAATPRGGFIGPLARELGIRPATLRKWERAGLVRPRRDPVTGYRVYAEADLRDARLAHQLRRGGHSLKGIATVLEQVRTAGGPEPLEATLRDWHDRVCARGLAMLTGAAELAAYLREEPGKATA